VLYGCERGAPDDDLPTRIALAFGVRRAREQPAALGAQPREGLVHGSDAGSDLFLSIHRISNSKPWGGAHPAVEFIAISGSEAASTMRAQRNDRVSDVRHP
jgi:hypothetical protein